MDLIANAVFLVLNRHLMLLLTICYNFYYLSFIRWLESLSGKLMKVCMPCSTGMEYVCNTWTLYYIAVAQRCFVTTIIKKTVSQVFKYAFWDILGNNFLAEHLWATITAIHKVNVFQPCLLGLFLNSEAVVRRFSSK